MANVLFESGTLTSIENFTVNCQALQVENDTEITIESRNINCLYEIGGKIYDLSSSGTLDN